MQDKNTSARIVSIQDERAEGPMNTYDFAYSFINSNDPFPHLQSISNSISTPEAYSFVTSPYSLQTEISQICRT